ncbi:hypothetical protein DFO66_103137 [Brevibacterium sanguinis]|uniref:DUF6892 domain-containing protein n=2 Tax=Brevibacterium TaxID=1696 RepID=A0A366IMP2_9MICO|nr:MULTISPECIES: hypothetical protein [Brevibacterium]RBP66194.1 hypothetical protein DFO66_103137 [Brevibacterium sanguinis]RBP72845.1 hypothetical protein DFO65_103136 [Brevibacterium celere]
MTKTLAVDIRLDGIEIDGRLYEYPILLTDLKALFDEEPEELEGSRSSRTSSSWVWFDSGLSATHKDGVHALALKFDVDDPAHDVRIEGRPFGEEFGPQGPTYPSRDFGNGYIMARRSSDRGPDQRVRTIIVEQKVRRPAKKKQAAPGKTVKPAKSPEPKPSVDPAEFTDLNFKLLVLQDLMYDQQLLTPAFQLGEFIEHHVDREIDLDEEGYAPIPEALAYFAEYPVPRELLGRVVELVQDGGNDIYLQIAPLWDGEDDVFDVKDFADVDLLPELRSLTLTGVDEVTLESLREKGIEADLL